MLEEKSFYGVKILSINKIELEKRIKEIIKKIKKDKNVLKVIIFGSFIRDDFLPSSDIDLLIILKETKENFLKRQDNFIKYFEGLHLDANIFIYTKNEFEKMLKEENKFILEAKKGKILYENPNP